MRFQKGNIPWNKGLNKESDARLLSVSQKVSRSLLGKTGPAARHNKPHSEKTKEIIRQKALSPERIKLAIQNLPKDMKGENHPFWGRHHTTESKMKIAAHRDTKGKNHPLWGKHRSIDTKRKLSLAHKKLWQQPEYASQQMQFRGAKPNKIEVLLQQFLDTYYPGEWKYVGDGQVIIGGRCPDFLNVNGGKQVIELFGTYWHDIFTNPRTRLERTEVATCYHYSDYGFACLVIWDKELKKPSKLRKKLDVFVSKR